MERRKFERVKNPGASFEALGRVSFFRSRREAVVPRSTPSRARLQEYQPSRSALRRIRPNEIKFSAAPIRADGYDYDNRWLSPPANIHLVFQTGQKKKAFLGPKDVAEIC